MRDPNLLFWLMSGDRLEAVLPDFVIAVTFFTALIYAVLAKRFERQRAAAIAALAMGLALASGLIWWEQQVGLSIMDLGPFAAGFAILLLGAIIFQAVRQVGGSFAGVGIALGISLLISKLLAINWPLDAQVIQTATTVALVVGAMAFMVRMKSHSRVFSPAKPLASPIVRHDMRDIERGYQQGRVLSDHLGRRLRCIRDESGLLHQHPELAGDIVCQIKRTLPVEGSLTECMARLRKKAHQIRNGHVARLEETRKIFAKLPASARKAASADLASRYQQLIGIDKRLERLDKAVAANEKRIRELTGRAEKYAVDYNYRKLTDVLKEAENLQKHNSKLFKLIDRTEARLSAVAERVAKETSGADRA